MEQDEIKKKKTNNNLYNHILWVQHNDYIMNTIDAYNWKYKRSVIAASYQEILIIKNIKKHKSEECLKHRSATFIGYHVS